MLEVFARQRVRDARKNFFEGWCACKDKLTPPAEYRIEARGYSYYVPTTVIIRQSRIRSLERIHETHLDYPGHVAGIRLQRP